MADFKIKNNLVVEGASATVNSQPVTTNANTQTFTNKTFDADGTGNSITNIENADIKAGAAIDASKIADGSVSSTEFQYINSLTSNAQTQLDAKVTGPASATDEALARFDGTTGKLVQNSLVTVSDAGVMSGATQLNVDNLRLDGSTLSSLSGDLLFSPAGEIDANSHLIHNVASPVSAQDAANKAYVDAAINGLDWKQSVRAATTVAGTLASDFEDADVIDGITLATGDRILIKNQASAVENGIYIVNGSGAPTRSTDADSSGEVTAGMATFVEEGTVNADTGWVLASDNPIVLDTDPLSFVQFSSAGVVLAGTGLSKTGNTINFNAADTSLTVNADDVAVNLNTTGGLETSSGVRIKSDTATANTIGITTTANGAGVKFDSASFADSGSETLALAAGVAGDGLDLTAGVLSVAVTEIAGAGLENDGSNNLRLAASVAGDGLAHSAGVLSVNVDNSTIEINTDTLRVKDAGITNAKVASGIDAIKIGDGSVSNSEFKYLDGSLPEGTQAIAESQTDADVTGLVFANASYRSFKALVHVVIDATADLFEAFELLAVQKGAGWDMSQSAVGDSSGISFSISAAGQVQYTSGTYAGFSSGEIKFKAISLTKTL